MTTVMYDSNIDDFGWYEVGGDRFYNKLEAIYKQTTTKLPLIWNLNDVIYDTYKWDVEPTESLESLYAARAFGIRNKYDYLVLHFSGGTDSANILQTCIDNNIFVDEVCIRGSFNRIYRKGVGVCSAADAYAECLAQAVPLAQEVKDKHFPLMKITLIETTEIVQKYLSDPTWFETGIPGFTTTAFLRSDIDSLNPDWKKLQDKGVKVAHINGYDKPRIFKKDDYFYTQWTDATDNGGIRVSKSGHPQYSEAFYWGINAVTMQIKQLHAIKNYIKAHNIPERAYAKIGSRPVENFFASIIYNRKMPLLSEHDKESRRSILRDADSWILEDKLSPQYQNYLRGIKHMEAAIPDEWHHEKGFWVGGVTPMFSKPRYLGT